MTSLVPRYVSTPAQLATVVEAVAATDWVGIDTEFIGEKTYEPELCLLQIATPEAIWIVDPLPLDLTALWTLLTDPAREVVLLAAREEIRFCLRYGGRAPARLLDIQVAAGLVGYGYPLSHTNLVRRVLGVNVQGGEAFTDWKRRPLTQSQIEYAADDVRHLKTVRDRLLADAARLGREEWVWAECARLSERITVGEQEERWWKMPGSPGLSRRELGVLRELWRWRDSAARAENVPPRRLLRDEMLVEIAKRRPKTVEDLYALRGLDRVSAKTTGPALVAAVNAGLALPDSELPQPLRRVDPPQLGVLTQLLSMASNNLATTHQVDPALLATVSDLQDVVRWRLNDASDEDLPTCLQGWRGEILRQPLLDLLEGRRGIRVRDFRAEAPLGYDG